MNSKQRRKSRRAAERYADALHRQWRDAQREWDAQMAKLRADYVDLCEELGRSFLRNQVESNMVAPVVLIEDT